MKATGPAALFLVTALGCAHAKTTDGEPKSPEASQPSEPSGTTNELPRKPGHPPVATHADDLLKPGAEEKIRRKLAAGGYLSGGADAPLADGVRKFQAAHDMPATGVPDHETVRRLGLDPAEIFRD
jgi:hypothetical protein